MSRLDTTDFDTAIDEAMAEMQGQAPTTTAPAETASTPSPALDFDAAIQEAMGEMQAEGQQAQAQQQAQQQEQQRIDVNLYVDQEASRLSVPVTVMEQMVGEGRGQTMDPMTGQARFGPLVGEELQELQQSMTERVGRHRTSVLGTQLHKIGMALGAPTHEQIAEREANKYGGEWVRDATAAPSEAFPRGGWRWQRYDKIDAQLKYATDRLGRLGRLSELSYQGLVGTAAAGLEALRKFAKVSQALDPAQLGGKGVGEVLADMKSRWDAKDTPYWLQHPMTAVQRWDQEHPPEVPLDNWIDFGSDIGAMFLELWLMGKTGVPSWVGGKAEKVVKAGLRAPAVEFMRRTGSRIFAKEARAQQWIANLGKWMATIGAYTAPANLRGVVAKELEPLEGVLHTVGAGPALIKDVNAGLVHYLTQTQGMTPEARASEDVLAHRERISHLQPLGVVLALWAGHRYSAGRAGMRAKVREGQITGEREQVRQAIEAARTPAEVEARPKIPELVEKAKAEPEPPKAEAPAEFDWSKAKPGDRLPDGTFLVRRRIRVKRDARELAARVKGGRVSIDGPRTWAVTAEEMPRAKQPPAKVEPPKPVEPEAPAEKPGKPVTLEGFHTEAVAPTRGPKFIQRGEGFYIALDKPFQPEKGNVARVRVQLDPKRIFDPNGLLEGTDVAKSKADHQRRIELMNSYQKGRQPTDPLKAAAADHTRALRELGYDAEVGWIDGPEGKARELVVFDRGAVETVTEAATPAAEKPKPAKPTVLKVQSTAPEGTAKELAEYVKAGKMKAEDARSLLAADIWSDAAGKDPVTGQPVILVGYRGSGRETKETAYGKGITEAALGEGAYYAPNSETAKTYGPKVEVKEITLRNPLVLTATDDVRNIMGGQFYSESGAAEMADFARRFAAKVRELGHDSVIVNIRGHQDIDAQGRSHKQLRRIFDHSQVVVFAKRAARAAKAEAEKPAGPPEAKEEAKAEPHTADTEANYERRARAMMPLDRVPEMLFQGNRAEKDVRAYTDGRTLIMHDAVTDPKLKKWLKSEGDPGLKKATKKSAEDLIFDFAGGKGRVKLEEVGYLGLKFLPEFDEPRAQDHLFYFRKPGERTTDMAVDARRLAVIKEATRYDEVREGPGPNSYAFFRDRKLVAALMGVGDSPTINAEIALKVVGQEKWKGKRLPISKGRTGARRRGPAAKLRGAELVGADVKALEARGREPADYGATKLATWEQARQHWRDFTGDTPTAPLLKKFLSQVPEFKLDPHFTVAFAGKAEVRTKPIQKRVEQLKKDHAAALPEVTATLDALVKAIKAKGMNPEKVLGFSPPKKVTSLPEYAAYERAQGRPSSLSRAIKDAEGIIGDLARLEEGTPLLVFQDGGRFTFEAAALGIKIPEGAKAGQRIRVDPTLIKSMSKDSVLVIELSKGAPAKAAGALGMPAEGEMFPRLPTAPTPGKPAEQQAVVKNAQREIYESLRDMGTVARAFKSRAYLGQYRRTERIIEMVKTGNYSTAFHEIGHYVSDMWNEAMLRTAGKRPTDITHGKQRQPIWKSFDTESRKWLIQMGKALYGDKKPAGGYAEEGWAEFMRWWIADPVEALKLAPTDAIREAMGARLDQVFSKYPKLRAPMERLRENWRTLIEAEPEAVMDSQIVQDPRPPKGLFGRLTWWLQYRSAFTDTNAVIRQMEKEAGLTSEGATYKLFQKFTGGSSSGRAKFWMEDYVNSFTGEKRAESPKTILSRFKTGKEKRDFMRWIVALRALSREQRGQPMGFDIGPLAGRRLLRTIVEKYDSPEFREGAEQWRRMNDAMVDYVVDAGGLDPKIGQKIKDSDPVYVPFMRIFLEEARPVQAQGKGRGWVDLPKVVKRMKGTTHGRPILEPMHAMQLYVARLVQIADKTRAARALSQMVRQYPQLRRFFQPLHPYEIPKLATRQSLAELAEHLEKRFGIVLGVEDQVGELRKYGKAEGETLDQMLTIFTNSAVYFGKEPFVSVWQGGKQRWYKVDPLVHTALKGFDPLRLPRIVDVTVGGFNRWAKLAWTGLNPRFTFGTNPSRDIFQAAIATTAGRSPPRMFEEGGRVGLRFGEDPDSMLREVLRENNFVMQRGKPKVWTAKATPEARGIAHRTTQLGRLRKYDPLGVGEFGNAIRKMVGGAEIWDLYKGQGLEFTQFLGGDLRSMDYQMRRVMASTALQRANNIVNHPIEALRATLLPTDAPSRLAEFERVLRRRGWEPGKPISESAIIEASYAAGEVTLPFNRAGYVGRYMNQWAAFTNPAIQAASKTVRLLGPEQALTTILRGVPLITVPAVVSWWWVKDRPEWKEKQPFLKAFFLNLPLGDEPGATIWSFPMPYELGWLFAGLPISMLDAMYQDNPKRVKEWLGDAITTLVPEFVPTVARPWLDVLMNRKWTGAPIEPKWMEGLVPEARYNKYTPTLARVVSRVLGGAISPVQADHVLRGYGGWPLLNAGRYLHEAGVLVGLVPELPWVDYDRDIPVVGWFKRRAIGPGATSIRYFYDRLEVLRKKYQTLRAGRWQRQPPSRAELGEYRAMEKTARVLGELWREAREPKVDRERLNLIYEEIVARTKKHVWNEVNGRARVVPPAGKGRAPTNMEIMQGKIAELLVKDRQLKEQDPHGRGLRGREGKMLKDLRIVDMRINKLLKVPVDQYDANAERAERMAARAVRLIQRAERRQR